MKALAKDKLLGRGAGSIAIRFLSAGIGLGLAVVIAQWTNADEFGRFGFAFSLALTLSFVLDFGQRQLILRSLTAYAARGRKDLFLGIGRFSTRISVAAAVFSCALVLAGYFAFGLHASLVPAAVLAAAMIIGDYQVFLLRSLDNLFGSLIPKEIVWRPLSLALMAFAGGGIAVVTDAVTALWVLAGVLVALNVLQLVFVVLPTWRVHLSRIEEAKGTDLNPEETLEQARTSWIASSGRLWLVSAVNAGFTPASVVVVGLFVPPAEAGAFFAAVRIATLISLPLQGLNMMVSPMLARSFAQNARDELRRLVGFTALASSAAAFVGFLVVLVAGRWMLGIMNEEFVFASTTLTIIAAGFVVGSICGSSGQLMVMTGHEREFVRILVVSNSLGFAAMVLFAWLYGGIGAAWGLLIVKAAWNLSVIVWARRNLRIDPSILAWVFPIGSKAA